MSAIIDLINKNISPAVNKSGDNYKAIIGDKDFTPAGTITTSDDYDCGAITNELEYARLQTGYLTESFDPAHATQDLLDLLVMALINLPRMTTSESDASYRQRFNLIVRQQTNTTRCTRSAISDAIQELGLSLSQFHLVEWFDSFSKYFQLRLVGVTAIGGAVMSIDSMRTGFLDQYFVGGLGVGQLQTYISGLVQRVKALGVHFDLIIVDQNNLDYNSNAKITA